jgi:ankyrin repeat protein
MKALDHNNKAARYLLEKGADPNKISGDPLIPPIMVPLEHGRYFRITETQVEQVKLLIRYGADVNGKGEENISPLEYARTIREDEGREIVIS